MKNTTQIRAIKPKHHAVKSTMKNIILSLLSLILIATSQLSWSRTTTYYHTDGLGSVVAASDESGQLLWRKHYAPYGEQVDGDTDNEPLSYTGKQHDDVSGLTYFGARYYDPEVGRFMGIDPAGVLGNIESNPMMFNRYAYANNNTYKFLDPDGESPLDVGFFAMDAVAFGVAVASGNPLAIQSAGVDLALSAIGLASPVPGTGLALKAVRSADKVHDVAKVAKNGKTYQTYTKTNPKTGEVYSGRTSGTGTPEQNLARRDANHHMNDQGYGPAVLDKSSANSAAIRGREQQLIQANGGAKSTGGTSGNAINGVSASNPKGPGYRYESYKEFGE